MQHDVYFASDAYTRVVRLPVSGGPAPNRIEIDDARSLFTAHFKKSGPGLILTNSSSSIPPTPLDIQHSFCTVSLCVNSGRISKAIFTHRYKAAHSQLATEPS